MKTNDTTARFEDHKVNGTLTSAPGGLKFERQSAKRKSKASRKSASPARARRNFFREAQ